MSRKAIYAAAGLILLVSLIVFTLPKPLTDEKLNAERKERTERLKNIPGYDGTIRKKEWEEMPPPGPRKAVQRIVHSDRVEWEDIEDQFSPWDGSHRKLVDDVTRRMNDPESFEHIETNYFTGTTSSPNTYVVRMEYTGKNMFGGRERGTVLAEVSVNSGRVIEILDEL